MWTKLCRLLPRNGMDLVTISLLCVVGLFLIGLHIMEASSEKLLPLEKTPGCYRLPSPWVTEYLVCWGSSIPFKLDSDMDLVPYQTSKLEEGINTFSQNGVPVCSMCSLRLSLPSQTYQKP